MQPCSHPRYGFKLVSKPTSGLVLRVIIVLVPSRKYCVGRRGVSSVSQPTSTTSGSVKSTCSFSNRFAGLQDAPRPRIGGVALRRFDDHRFKLLIRRHDLSSHEHITLSSKSLSSCYTCAPITDHQFFRRGGRAVDRAGLENRKAERPREFESHPLRHFNFRFSIGDFRLAAIGSALRQARTRFPEPLRKRRRRDNGRRYTSVRTRSESGLGGTQGRCADAR